jgi:hypothetical protein
MEFLDTVIVLGAREKAVRCSLHIIVKVKGSVSGTCLLSNFYNRTLRPTSLQNITSLSPPIYSHNQ